MKHLDNNQDFIYKGEMSKISNRYVESFKELVLTLRELAVSKVISEGMGNLNFYQLTFDKLEKDCVKAFSILEGIIFERVKASLSNLNLSDLDLHEPPRYRF